MVVLIVSVVVVQPGNTELARHPAQTDRPLAMAVAASAPSTAVQAVVSESCASHDHWIYPSPSAWSLPFKTDSMAFAPEAVAEATPTEMVTCTSDETLADMEGAETAKAPAETEVEAEEVAKVMVAMDKSEAAAEELPAGVGEFEVQLDEATALATMDPHQKEPSLLPVAQRGWAWDPF